MSVLKDKVNKLLSDLRKGRKEAFKELYDATYHHLRIVARNYIFHADDTDEVLNVAFFRIYKYAGSSKPDCDGYNWMCKIVQNAAYDINKQHHVTIPVNKIEDNRLFEELYSNALERSDLITIIRIFDELDQKLIYLKFWEDLTYSEIAKKLGRKKTAVYVRINKLLKIIQEKLGRE